MIGTLWVYKKSLYMVMGECRLEATNEPAVIYRSLSTGIMWTRSKDEFLDGRFERCPSWYNHSSTLTSVETYSTAGDET